MLKLALSFFAVTMAAATVHASPVVWDLNNVVFNDGASGAGYFIYDGNSDSLLDWDIATLAGSLTAGFSYTTASSTAAAGAGGCALEFLADGNSAQSLCLNPEAALIPGTTPELLSSSFESFSGGERTVVSGGVVDAPPPGGGSAVPEPADFAMMTAASVVLAGLSRRRARWFAIS